MRLFNTLALSKDEFRPINSKNVGIYTCGPTVYDIAHIGNLRAYVTADVLVRFLRFSDYKVKWVVNITDIDDKTIAGAKKAGESLRAFTDKYEKQFYQDLAKLNIQKADIYPRATEHFKPMREIVGKLKDKGLAYQTNDGVYFDISKFPKYGKLSGLAKRELKPGARVDVDSYDKQSPGDFALWKFQKSDSPISDIRSLKSGRPGWHLECSAMSRQYLGQPFDIHTGGIDLVFPHHENEIAQSVGAYGKPLANYFFHNEHLLVEGKKMAKSEGSYITLSDAVMKGYDPLALRYLYLQSHYRDKMNFRWQALQSAQIALENVRENLQRSAQNAQFAQVEQASDKRAIEQSKAIRAALEDDLNTPQALGLLHEAGDSNLWLKFDEVLGLGLRGSRKPLKLLKMHKLLIKEREQLRKAGKFDEADKIRQQLSRQGIELEDTPQGPRILTKN